MTIKFIHPSIHPFFLLIQGRVVGTAASAGTPSSLTPDTFSSSLIRTLRHSQAIRDIVLLFHNSLIQQSNHCPSACYRSWFDEAIRKTSSENSRDELLWPLNWTPFSP
ncbi:hypothetical protein NQD34_004337 [Periophthalmus magnuspinnatus]|nr:hypothetical protein NQD34_004337 [Periophthalmus magnuspinnatus]